MSGESARCPTKSESPQHFSFKNVHVGPSVDFFINYEQKYYTFKMSGFTFRKVQEVNLHMIQNLGEYSALIF